MKIISRNFLSKKSMMRYLVFGIFLSVFIYCAKETTTTHVIDNTLTKPDDKNIGQKVKSTLEQIVSKSSYKVSRNKRNSVSNTITQDPCFDPGSPGANCDSIAGGPFVDTIDLPAPYYPCRAIVSYDLYYCYDNSSHLIIRVVFSNFTAVPEPGSNCQGLIDSLVGLDTTMQYSQLKAALDAFINTAKDVEEESVMRQLTYAYQNIFPCSSPNTFLESKFYTELCYTYCTRVVHHSTYWEFLSYQINCGHACCTRTILWCWDNVHNRVYKSSASYSSSGSCTTDNATCDLGYTKSGSCTEATCEP